MTDPNQDHAAAAAKLDALCAGKGPSGLEKRRMAEYQRALEDEDAAKYALNVQIADNEKHAHNVFMECVAMARDALNATLAGLQKQREHWQRELSRAQRARRSLAQLDHYKRQRQGGAPLDTNDPATRAELEDAAGRVEGADDDGDE